MTGPLNLIGYSFGARAVTGSLQLLSGGCVAGRQLPADTAKNPTTTVGGPIRVMLVAGAMDCDWLLPGHCEGAALALIDRLFVAQNACDPVLRFYSRLYGRGGPEALGFVGLCGATSNAKIEAADVSGSVGRSHHWDHYEVAPEFVGAESLCVSRRPQRPWGCAGEVSRMAGCRWQHAASERMRLEASLNPRGRPRHLNNT